METVDFKTHWNFFRSRRGATPVVKIDLFLDWNRGVDWFLFCATRQRLHLGLCCSLSDSNLMALLTGKNGKPAQYTDIFLVTWCRLFLWLTDSLLWLTCVAWLLLDGPCGDLADHFRSWRFAIYSKNPIGLGLDTILTWFRIVRSCAVMRRCNPNFTWI